MNIQLTSCRVHFPEDYDERGEWEVERKGWLQGVQVEMPNGLVFPLFFYDPVRLAQDLEADERQGRSVMAEPGMVVIQEVTRSRILQAVEELVHQRFFDHLKPLVPAEANGIAH
jgi:hypothetical protein